MCGFSIIRSLTGRQVDAADLRAMCSVIAHRGPDGGGLALLDRGTLGLAHVRLSVIDLETGDQPLSSEDGQVTIVFNGELYDYQHHRDLLQKRGHRFATTSDTEVLLHLYLEYGVDCFSRLNGEFAFAIWDARQQKLVVVKDRFGIKPLFYYQTDKEILFVSEIKSLFALPRIPRSFHPDFFTSAYFGTFTPATHLFENIRPLPPGNYLWVERGQVSHPQPYWQPTFRVRDSMSFDEATTGVEALLTQAVERRTVADVAVGTYLSGGIDSTLLCGLMSRRMKNVRAFNIGFGNTKYDESALARRIAEYYGVQFETVDCTSEVLAENFAKTILHVETPLVNPNSVAKLVLSRLVRNQGYKVCLTGEGSDEVFGGYPYFKQELLWQMLKPDQPDIAADAKRLLKKFYAMEKRSEGFLWNRDIQGREVLPAWLPHANFHFSRMRNSRRFVEQVFRPEFLATTSARTPLEFFEKTFDTAQLSGLDGFNVSKLITFQQLSNYIIPCLGDRVELANSVECRTPFLDNDLVEFVSQIPPRHFVNIAELKEKYLLRRAFRELLPSFMEREHKHPFLSPSWYHLSRTRSGRELFASLLDLQLADEVGIFRRKLIQRAQFYWNIIPGWTTLWRRVDIALGQVCSVHLLYQQMIQSPGRGDRDFVLRDRSPTPTANFPTSF